MKNFYNDIISQTKTLHSNNLRIAINICAQLQKAPILTTQANGETLKISVRTAAAGHNAWEQEAVMRPVARSRPSWCGFLLLLNSINFSLKQMEKQKEKEKRPSLFVSPVFLVI